MSILFCLTKWLVSAPRGDRYITSYKDLLKQFCFFVHVKFLTCYLEKSTQITRLVALPPEIQSHTQSPQATWYKIARDFHPKYYFCFVATILLFSVCVNFPTPLIYKVNSDIHFGCLANRITFLFIERAIHCAWSFHSGEFVGGK